MLKSLSNTAALVRTASFGSDGVSASNSLTLPSGFRATISASDIRAVYFGLKITHFAELTETLRDDYCKHLKLRLKCTKIEISGIYPSSVGCVIATSASGFGNSDGVLEALHIVEKAQDPDFSLLDAGVWGVHQRITWCSSTPPVDTFAKEMGSPMSPREKKAPDSSRENKMADIVGLQTLMSGRVRKLEVQAEDLAPCVQVFTQYVRSGRFAHVEKLVHNVHSRIADVERKICQMLKPIHHHMDEHGLQVNANPFEMSSAIFDRFHKEFSGSLSKKELDEMRRFLGHRPLLEADFTLVAEKSVPTKRLVLPRSNS